MVHDSCCSFFLLDLPTLGLPQKIHCNMIQGTDQGRVECLFVAPAVAALSPFPIFVPIHIPVHELITLQSRLRSPRSPVPGSDPLKPEPWALLSDQSSSASAESANPRSASSSPSSLLLHSPPDQTRGTSHAPWRTTCLRLLAHRLPLLVLFDVTYHPGSPLIRPS